MDYEKAYKESFEAAKGLHDAGNALTKKQMEIVFPQLAESEDERIRKRIRLCLDECVHSDIIRDYERDECLAYIEKQKEPHFTKRNALFDKCVENCDPEIMKRVSDEVDEMLQKEQKPAEWNANDKAIVNCIVCCLDGQFVPEATRKQSLEWFNKHRRDFLNQTEQEWREEDEVYLQDALWCVKQATKVAKSENDMGACWSAERWLKSLRLQPKQEWSEEDEDMLNSCISSIEEAKENRYAYKETDGDTSYDHEIAWLKSLRPVGKEFLQPHWKPSEEQMNGLANAINLDVYDAERYGLDSLYNDLKKLM